MQEQIVSWILAGSWLALSAFVVGAIVRAVKAGWWPQPLRVAPKYRELTALALGALSGVLEAAAAGTPWKEAVARGVVSGAIAILGHHVLIEWLRGGRELGSDVVKKGTFVALVLLLVGCAQAGQIFGAVLDLARVGADVYFARHPNAAAEDRVRQAELAARAAHKALEAARVAGEDDATAKARALQAYEELRVLLDELGVADAVAPAGGAETESSEPKPLYLPTADELAGAV